MREHACIRVFVHSAKLKKKAEKKCGEKEKKKTSTPR